MKKIILIALCGLVMSCNGIIGDGYKISGEINGLKDGTRVFLEKQDPEKGTIIPVDTVKLENGKFTFEGKAVEPEMHSIKFENADGGFLIIVEKGNIKAVVNKDSISKAKVTGTTGNDDLKVYFTGMGTIEKRMMAFQQKNGPVMQEAQQKNDTVIMNRLSREYAQFQVDIQNAKVKFIEGNPKSFLTALLVEQMFYEMEPKLELITKYYEGLDSKVKETKPGKRIKAKLDDSQSVAVGKVAPDFSAKSPDGKMTSLKQSLGKVTIIDFWASWCAPCRQENPNVVALYNEFHAKGLNIVGVSLDREGEADKWKEAITKDKLTWTQVSNLKFWEDPIAMKYGIKSIPATILLDADGKIVAKNLHGAELKAKVAELLAK